MQPDDLARGLPIFPVVSAAVGASVALVAIVSDRVFPAVLAGLLAVSWQALVTGGLHLDGLADVADSYGAGMRERALEIMRDPAVGSFGVVALVLDVSLKATAIAALLPRGDALGAIVAASSLGATSALLGLALPYAGAGTGRFLRGTRPAVGVCTAVVAVLIAAVALRLRSLAAIALAVVVLLLWGAHCRRRLGGVTGDTLGAGTELIQLAVLLVAVAVHP